MKKFMFIAAAILTLNATYTPQAYSKMTDDPKYSSATDTNKYHQNLKKNKNYGPVANELVKKYGVKVIDYVRLFGPQAIIWINDHGFKPVKMAIKKHGIKLVLFALDYGPKAMDLVIKHGDQGMMALKKYKAHALDMFY